MDKQIEAMLEAISEVVDDDHTKWEKKKELIKTHLEASERYALAFEEIVSWFAQDYE